MTNSYIDRLGWVHIKDYKMLKVHERNDAWYIPGGKRELGESDEQALTRELKEELDIDLVESTITHCGTFEAQAYDKPEGVMVRVICYTGEYRGELKPSNEVDDFSYFGYDAYDMLPPVGKLLFDDLKAKGLIN